MNQRLAELLPDVPLRISCANLGFAGKLDLPNGHFDLAIGHSLGALWLLNNNRSECVTFDRLAIVNGFTRFSLAHDFPTGCPQSVVENMRTRLAIEPQALLDEFFANSEVREFVADCGVQPGLADNKRLDWGLEALIHVDGRQQWKNFDGPRKVIAATRDQIARMEHTRSCFSDEDTRWIKSDCHCLPAKFPELCAASIRDLIETPLIKTP